MKIGPSQNFEALEPRLVMSGDRLGPLAPDAIALTAASDTGVVGDSITRDRTPEFTWQVPRDRGGRFPAGTSPRYEWRVERVDAGMPELTAFGSAPTRGVTTTLAEGNYRFSIRYQDNGNRWGDWGQRAFTITSSTEFGAPIRLTDSPATGVPRTYSANPTFEIETYGKTYTEFRTELLFSRGQSVVGTFQSNIVRPADGVPGGLPTGPYTLFVSARDGDGQIVHDWSSLFFRVLPTEPRAPEVPRPFEEWRQQPNGEWSFNTFLFWNPSDYEVNTYYWQVHGSAGEILALGRLDGTTAWHPPSFIPGATTFYVRAENMLGNLSSWTSRSLTDLGFSDQAGPFAPKVRMSPQDNALDDQFRNQDDGSDTRGYTSNRMPRFEWTRPADVGASQTYLVSVGRGSEYRTRYYGNPSGTSSEVRWTIRSSSGEIVASGDQNSPAGPTSPLEDGTYFFGVAYLDNVGNVGRFGSISFIVAPLLSAPKIDLVENGASNDNNTDDIITSSDPVFDFSPQHPVLETYTEYYWALHRSDGTQFHGVSRSSRVRPSDTYPALANLPDGRHTMFVRARTNTGELTNGWGEKVFGVATTPPTAMPRLYVERYDRVPDFIRLANAPLQPGVTSGRVIGGTPFVTAVWQMPADPAAPLDNRGYRIVYKVESADGTIVSSNNNIPEWTTYTGYENFFKFRVGISWLPAGSYRLFARAVDGENRFGAWTQAEGGPFTVDSTVPTAPLLTSGPTDPLAIGTAADFSWLGSTDTGPGPVRYVVKLEYLDRNSGTGTGSYQTFQLVEGTSARITPESIYGAGRVRWSVYAFDQADNAIESGFGEFTMV